MKRKTLEQHVIVWQHQLKLGEMFSLAMYPIYSERGIYYEHYADEWRIEYRLNYPSA